MLQMVSQANRSLQRLEQPPRSILQTPSQTDTDADLLVARMLFQAGRVCEASTELDCLPPTPSVTPLKVHVKHTLGQITEAIDALECGRVQ